MNEQSSLLRIDHGNGVAGIGLNQAPVNALTPEFLRAFGDLVEDLVSDDTVKAIVLSSDFKVFSAGLNLKEAMEFDLDQQFAIVEALNRDFLRLFTCSKPVVAAVNGAAIAGGLFFVLAADFCVAGPKAQFGLAEVRVGANLPVGPMEIARATIDTNTLRQLLLTGLPLRADRAHQVGMVDVLVEDPDEVLAQAVKQAQMLADLPPLAYANIKRDLRAPAVALIEEGIANGGNRPEGGWFTAETKGAMQKMIGG